MMAMSPQEVADAFKAGWTGEEIEKFDRLCEQLRAGVLVLETRPDGFLIRAARPEGESDL